MILELTLIDNAWQWIASPIDKPVVVEIPEAIKDALR